MLFHTEKYVCCYLHNVCMCVRVHVRVCVMHARVKSVYVYWVCLCIVVCVE